jgi:hypothetical protein
MRQRTLLITLAVVAFIAAAGIVVVLQPDDAVAQRQQQGLTVSFVAHLDMRTSGD